MESLKADINISINTLWYNADIIIKLVHFQSLMHISVTKKIIYLPLYQQSKQIKELKANIMALHATDVRRKLEIFQYINTIAAFCTM